MALAIASLLTAPALKAQGGQTEGTSPRDPDQLAMDNSDLVSASAEQISAVLRMDPGLFLELKHLMAHQAADLGQVVVEADLTDTAVLNRLQADAKFRHSATELLQRYGYLLPKATAAGQDDRSGATGAEKLANRIEQQKGLERSPERPRPVAATGAIAREAGANPPELPRDSASDATLQNPSGEATTALGGTLLAGTGSAANAAATAADASGASALVRASAVGPASLSLAAEQPLVPASAPAEAAPASTIVAASANRAKAPTADNFEAEAAKEAALPSALQHRSPYLGIPSIYDMYAHASAYTTGAAQRFGEDIFGNSTDAGATIPMDFPATPDYVVGPGDGLTINLWGGVSQRIYATVDHEGRIALPESGPLLVSGQSLEQVQQSVQRMLRTQFRDVSADVSLSRLRTVRIYVVGDVNGPGAYDVSSLSTPLNALIAAGGPTSGGSMRVLRHMRGDTLVQEVDLYDLLLRGVRSDLKPLQPGDTLVVPEIGEQVRVDGFVRRPAIYELHGETNLAQVVDLAGGLLPEAALNRIEVQRLVDHDKRTMLSVDASGGGSADDDIEKQLAAFTVHDRDEIHIFPVATFNQDAVYLLGHVVREGRYAYKPGMRLTDLISSYSDLLPEPAAHYAEIIRVNAPDYHPSVQSFDLAAVLANPASAPTLQPMDTVRIFSRFDFEDEPTVTVSGAVRKPGMFLTEGQVHFRDAIQLAGGLTPDASMDSAQIIRPLPDSSLTVLNIRVKDALSGDPINNILLQPRDHVLIQENVLADDPKTVLIGGQVANPGRYPLTPNLRVSELIELAGGFRRGAETDVADLTQFIANENAPIVAAHVDINLSAALGGDEGQDLLLHDGDVLTIRELPGWQDVGAAVSVKGEVKHPGTYGIRAGEKLSSVLERAGGFEPEGYPYGAILERGTVQELEVQSRDELMVRIKNAQNDLELQEGSDPDPKVKAAKELAVQQWETNLEQLNENPPVGRIAIRISTDIHRWENTAADISLQSGDTIIIPRKPGYVMVTGQVFNPTAVSYRPGRSASWYLSQSGGPTPLANKGAIFVIRADGSVIGGRKSGLWVLDDIDDPMHAALRPGDTVVVPEKALSANVHLQDVLLGAQVAASAASAIFIALRY